MPLTWEGGHASMTRARRALVATVSECGGSLRGPNKPWRGRRVTLTGAVTLANCPSLMLQACNPKNMEEPRNRWFWVSLHTESGSLPS